MSSQRPNSPYLYLRVVAGPHKGEVFRLSLKETSHIGRDETCAVSLNKDGRISRNHAQVQFSKGHVFIKNISSKNKILLNNKITSQSRVKNEDIIKLGSSEFKIVYKSVVAEKKKSSKGVKTKPKPIKFKSNKGRSKINPVTITIGLLICFLAYQFVQPAGPSSPNTKDRNVSSSSGRVSSTTPFLNTELSKIKTKNLPAQAQYVRGFRDFKKGQYESGLLHFQQCLALQPNHTLCQRYLGLARKKIQELIQYHMVLGRKYKDQKQYQACSSTFRNVTFLVRDPTKKTI